MFEITFIESYDQWLISGLIEKKDIVKIYQMNIRGQSCPLSERIA